MHDVTHLFRSQEASISTPWMIPLETIFVHAQNKTYTASIDLKIYLPLYFDVQNPFLMSEISQTPLRNQERHLSFLKGHIKDCEEMKYFLTNQEFKILYAAFLILNQMINDKKKCQSHPCRNQERHLSFLKGSIKDCEEMEYFLTSQEFEIQFTASLRPNQMIIDENKIKSSFQESGTSSQLP